LLFGLSSFCLKALVFEGFVDGLEEPVEGDGFYEVVKDIQIEPFHGIIAIGRL